MTAHSRKRVQTGPVERGGRGEEMKVERERV